MEQTAMIEKEETALATVKYTPVRLGEEEGGLSARDMNLPRAVILKDMTETLPAGSYVNSVTKELLPKKFVPLFFFKSYSKFDADLKCVWTTTNRNDARVVECLKQPFVKGVKPEMTEFINLLIVPTGLSYPLILSFASMSYKAGKEAVNMMGLQMPIGVIADTDFPQFINKREYELAVSLEKKGAKTFFVKSVFVPVGGNKPLPPAEQDKLTRMANLFGPVVCPRKNGVVPAPSPAATDENEATEIDQLEL